MRIETDRLAIEVAESGRLDTVGLRGRSAGSRSVAPLLTEVDLGGCRVDGAEVDWSTRTVALDADEVSVRCVAGELEVQLRHSFSTGFTTRLLIVNTGTAPRLVERLQLRAQPAADRRVSALVAGSRLCWAMQSAAGDGPVLTARLMSGAVAAVTEQGFELGRLRLTPGQRYVSQLRWELFATPRSVLAGPGRDVLLGRTAYELDEAVLLPDDPDAALVAPREVAVDTVDEPGAHGRELSVSEPGSYRVELRSADGDIRLDLSWVNPLPVQLDAWAEELLAGPKTGAGVVALESTAAALVVQTALGGGRLAEEELAADALDRHTAGLLDDADHRDDADSGEEATGRPVDPLTVLYLLGEHGRTGDTDVLAAALAHEDELLRAEGPPTPGLGLAVLRTVLAGVDAHAQVAPLVMRAVQRATTLAETDHGLAADHGLVVGHGPTADHRLAAELELLLAVRPLLPPEHPGQDRLVILVRALGAVLGAGLPGRLVTPPPVAEHGHLVAVLRMLPEDGLAGVTRSWGASPTMLAHRLTLEVLDRMAGLDAPDIGPAAAWLALGQRHA